MVGYTEEQLTTQKIPYEVGLARYAELAKGAATAPIAVAIIAKPPEPMDLVRIFSTMSAPLS
jgi:hypothetical protein